MSSLPKARKIGSPPPDDDVDDEGGLIYTEKSRDNLDRIVKSKQYLRKEEGDKIPDRLISRIENHIDSLGRVWKSEQSIIDPKTGKVSKKTSKKIFSVANEQWLPVIDLQKKVNLELVLCV